MTVGSLPPDGQLAKLLREQRTLAEIAVQAGLSLDAIEQFRANNSPTPDTTPPFAPIKRETWRHRVVFTIAPWLVSVVCLVSAVGFYALQHRGSGETIQQVAAAGEVTMPSPCVVMWQGATPLSIPGTLTNCQQASR